MSNSIPHRQLHERIAVNAARIFCPQCYQDKCGDNLVLHHDHLLNFARKVLRRCCRIVGTRRTWDSIWHSDGYRFLDERRFDPIYVCKTCNTGDGWGKTAGWCKKPRLYPSSMSLTIQEMADVRRMPKGNARWEAVAKLWADLRKEHVGSRRRIIRIAMDIANSYKL